MLASFAAAIPVLALLTVVPGPDVAVVTRVALASGPTAALRCSVGIVTGLLVWGALTVAGLAAVLAASATVYTVVKLAGAAYLLFLGVQTLWRARRTSGGRAPSPRSQAGQGRPYRLGIMTNLLNPKIAVFYTGLLPQLVPAHTPTTVVLLALVGIHAALSLAWLSLYAALLRQASSTIQRPRVRAALDRASGVVMIGLGIRVAAQAR